MGLDPMNKFAGQLHPDCQQLAIAEVWDETPTTKTYKLVPDQLKVHLGGIITTVPARAAETVLETMERANLAPPSECRSGECGFCCSLLLSGEVYIPPEGDGRRAFDRKLGYIHPCASYPVSDLEIEVTRGK